MTPDRFDQLARLWAGATSRRAFLRQVGATFLLGAIDWTGIPVPKWVSLADNPQCYPERAGMRCGDCGTCQAGQCIPQSIDPCRSRGIGFFGGRKYCARCDPKTRACVGCEAGQTCCNDGCCDGVCSANGSCCPPDMQCGDECCRGCAKCNKKTMQCEKPEPAKSCPENYAPVEGCCVCLPGLCGGKCCREKDETCLGGKCCKRCGLDGAVCCDGRVCCRERCQEPGERCCPCWEDISAEEGKAIADEARKNVKWVKDNGLVYGQNRKKMNTRGPKEPGELDCTLFTAKSLGDLNKKGHDLTSRNLDGNCNLRRLPPGEPPRAGDVVAQPRQSGPPGSQHVGVASGTPNGRGGHIGIAMGNSGAREGSIWGPEEAGGWFEGGDELHVYRPQKRNRNCKGG